MTFQCAKCGTVRPSSEFYQTSKLKRGHYADCKPCWDARARAYRKTHWNQCYATRQRYRRNNHDKVAALTRKSALQNRYGLTPEEYLALLVKQSYRCAICGTHAQETRSHALCVDHCHASNRVRGLLCDKCNRGLGAFNDDPLLLTKAAEFIKASQRGIEAMSDTIKTKRVCKCCGEPYFAGGEDDPNCCRTCNLLGGFFGSVKEPYRRFGSRHFGQTSGLSEALQKKFRDSDGIESHELTSDAHAVEYLERLFEAAKGMVAAAKGKCVHCLIEKRNDNVRVFIQCTACDWASIEREAQR